jgi:hypothetical protein
LRGEQRTVGEQNRRVTTLEEARRSMTREVQMGGIGAVLLKEYAVGGVRDGEGHAIFSEVPADLLGFSLRRGQVRGRIGQRQESPPLNGVLRTSPRRSADRRRRHVMAVQFVEETPLLASFIPGRRVQWRRADRAAANQGHSSRPDSGDDVPDVPGDIRPEPWQRLLEMPVEVGLVVATADREK